MVTMRWGVLILSLAAGAVEAAEGESLYENWRVLPPKAHDVVHGNNISGAWLRYDVRESYPATLTTAFIVDAMSAWGWTLYDSSSFEHPPPHTDGPFDRFLRPIYEKLGTHVWLARWRKPDLDEVVYRLVYSCAFERLGMHSVWAQVCGQRFHLAREGTSLLHQALNVCQVQEP